MILGLGQDADGRVAQDLRRRMRLPWTLAEPRPADDLEMADQRRQAADDLARGVRRQLHRTRDLEVGNGPPSRRPSQSRATASAISAKAAPGRIARPSTQ